MSLWVLNFPDNDIIIWWIRVSVPLECSSCFNWGWAIAKSGLRFFNISDSVVDGVFVCCRWIFSIVFFPCQRFLNWIVLCGQYFFEYFVRCGEGCILLIGVLGFLGWGILWSFVGYCQYFGSAEVLFWIFFHWKNLIDK